MGDVCARFRCGGERESERRVDGGCLLVCMYVVVWGPVGVGRERCERLIAGEERC